MRHVACMAVLAVWSAGSAGSFAHPPEASGESGHFLHAEHWSHAAPAPVDGRALTEVVSLGQGDHRYESVPDWCKLTFEGPMGNTHGGLVVDSAGFVYTNTDTQRSVMVFAPDGSLVRTFGEEFVGIHHMTIVREGSGEQAAEFLYAVHLAGDAVVKFTLAGEVVWQLGVPTESGKYDDNPGAYNPTSVAVTPNGDVFVADGYGRNWIHQFDKNRNYLRSFGGPGKEPGQFQTCHGLGIDTRSEKPMLIVCDREGRRLQRFTLSGEFVDVVASDLRRPCAIAFWGELMGVAELEGRVVLMDKDFKIVATLGDNPDRGQWANHGVPPEAWQPGVFTAPHSMNFDAAGNVYVQDWNASGRISKLKRLAVDRSDESR